MPEGLIEGEWSEQSVKVLRERYLLKNAVGEVVETPDQMAWRVSWDIACAEGKFGKTYDEIMSCAKEYYHLLVTHEFLPNSPTLANAGKNNGLQYSACYVIPVEDTIEGIFDGVKWQALIHHSGGGTGFAFSRLRPSGAIVGSTKGIASGPVPFMRVYDAATEQIKQGGMRRGANMGILRVDHPDVLEFIHCKESGGITNFNISVAATNAFMKAYFDGTKYDLVDPHSEVVVGQLDAQMVMNEIAEGAWKTGDPGMIFIDRINEGPANPVPSMGPVEATNPCVTGDTLISTQEGLIKMRDVVESHFEGGARFGGNMGLIIDKRTLDPNAEGTEDGRAIKFFDNGEKEVLRLETKAGLELTGTFDHKVLTPHGWVKLSEVNLGDEVCVQSGEGGFSSEGSLPFKFGKPTLPTKWSKELGQVLGWLVGDGWLRTGDKNCRAGLTFGVEDKEIMEYFRAIINRWYGKDIKPIERVRNTWHLSYHGKGLVDFFLQLGVKPVKAADKEVPGTVYQAPKEAVIGFLQGLFTADGTVNFRVGHSSYVRLTAKSKLLLKGVQLLLLNLGILSHIYNRARKPRKGMFTYTDVHGSTKTHALDGVCYELEISRESVIKFLETVGFLGGRHKGKTDRFYTKDFRSGRFADKVERISPAGKQRVYDLTEDKSYTFIANGIVSYDCGEQPLYPFDACNLGSIFLTYFVKEESGRREVDWEKLEKVTRLGVRFLDSVIERNPFTLPQIEETVKAIRRIGLGVGGWADMLVQLGIPYDSEEALELGEKIMRFINEKGHEASEELALERGPFPRWQESIYKDGKPLRNSTVTTIAPTGTIGIIADTSTGIEPFFAIAFKHYVKTNAIERTMYFLNPLFEKMALGQSWYTEEVKEKIASEGALAHVEEVPQEIKRIFVTAHDLSPEWHVRMQAAFQKYTDNAVSKTINLPNGATREDIKKAYLQAYETGCRGVTVYRDGSKSVQVLNLGTKEKPMQEAKKQTAHDEEAGQEKRSSNGHVNTVSLAQLRLRPTTKLSGVTYRMETPLGHAFITINSTADGEPFEVFIAVGHGGSDIAADAEAIGRLISMSLRIADGVSPRQIAWTIVDQLRGIGGLGAVGFGSNRVKSLADAVAKVLEDYLKSGAAGVKAGPGEEKGAEGPGDQVSPGQLTMKLTMKKDLCPSCGAAAFIYEEGCAKCLACGYAKC
ncbi:hypothetical protein A2721_01715 [Candidatus Gottesmanbacteria bacterium RIFCSPHIGHO2_01_FULL_47_48]|uniref:Ribonucleoside-diphosphate reductase n=1 Tax=Candidatus Gottesmanbacteria bacterium RIFCSPHIGHO2_01_FULL_47_48 TaxID=1798381 RepID=A0A1F6A1J1_9BACT|nr:MAG: hypothetical protein A2721_01715 [Candidatus Gottesmanbacteria bacterium RIFCSPHIGHO2_01_FULL_47_48]